MKTTTKDGFVTVEQTPVVIPDLTVKDLLSSIPCVPQISNLLAVTHTFRQCALLQAVGVQVLAVHVRLQV